VHLGNAHLAATRATPENAAANAVDQKRIVRLGNAHLAATRATPESVAANVERARRITDERF